MTVTLTFVGLVLINVIGMICAFFINFFSRRAGIVDVGWAVCMVVNAALPAVNRHFLEPSIPLVFWILPALFIAWYSRLGFHLLVRYSKELHEDSRYAAMRKAMGKHQHSGFFIFFMLQVIIAIGFSYPLWQWSQLPSTVVSAIPVWVWALVILWILIAGVGQTIADVQLSRFKANPANQGQVMQIGLWRYSRHPNYFCEWLFWLPLPIVGYLVGHSEWLVYPVLMYAFLRYLTGIPYSEQQSLAHRGQQYIDYQARTSAFFMLPVKNS